MEDTKTEIDPAAELTLREMADDYISGGTDIYQTLRDAYMLGYLDGCKGTDEPDSEADKVLDKWEAS